MCACVCEYFMSVLCDFDVLCVFDAFCAGTLCALFVWFTTLDILLYFVCCLVFLTFVC